MEKERMTETPGRRCLIISGGDYYIPDVRAEDYELVIACDRGYEYAVRAGIKADVILGDYDSAAARPDADAAPVVLTYSSDKDDTDTMLAVKYALSHDVSQIDICCGLGGRLDHTYGNIMSGALGARGGCVTRILGEDAIIWIFADTQIEIPRMDGWSLSCFSISDISRGVTIKGTKYEAEDTELTNASTLGNSNNWAQDTARICCGDGVMMVICSRLEGGEQVWK